MHKKNKRLMIIVASCFIIIMTTLLVAGLSAIKYNNQDMEKPNDKELLKSFESSVDWLVENKTDILNVNNPILWYFLDRSAEASGDKRIKSLVDTYYNKYISPSTNSFVISKNIWINMFKPGTRVSPVPFGSIVGMNYYSQYFIYALNCDEELSQLDSIRAQNEGEFCGSLYLFNPTCTTHQLMGIRFLQRENCGDSSKLASTVDTLQDKIVNELTYDIRVVDVYIQRVLMLVESGSADKVRNIWLRRIFDLQQPDGGWGNFQPLLQLDDEQPLYFGFGHGRSRTGNPRAGKTFLKVFGVGQPTSTFHATAQGVLLLALLINENSIKVSP